MNSGSCSRENGLHQFLEPVTLCWIKEAREQNSTTLENALLRFGVSFGVRINSVRPFEAKWTTRWPARCIKFLFWTFDHRVSTSDL